MIKTNQPLSLETSEGFLPPQNLTSRIHGQGKAEHSFLRSWQRESSSHSWLLHGIRGVGKASFAYVATRFLLSLSQVESKWKVSDLLTEPATSIFQQVATGTHPDFMTLTSKDEEELTIDQVRSLVNFLRKTPVSSIYRVGIVDSADHMNLEALNALLKIAEEPGRGIALFLICHDNSALPATLRSRCILLPFRPVRVEPIIKFLRKHGADCAIAKRVASLSSGSFYYARILYEAGGEKFISAFGKILSANIINGQKTINENISELEILLKILAEDSVAREAFRFLWQQFLSCAIRASLTKKYNYGDSKIEILLESLSARAYKILASSNAAFWQQLWHSSIPNLLASRSARGGDFMSAVSFALSELCDVH